MFVVRIYNEYASDDDFFLYIQVWLKIEVPTAFISTKRELLAALFVS